MQDAGSSGPGNRSGSVRIDAATLALVRPMATQSTPVCRIPCESPMSQSKIQVNLFYNGSILSWNHACRYSSQRSNSSANAGCVLRCRSAPYLISPTVVALMYIASSACACSHSATSGCLSGRRRAEMTTVSKRYIQRSTAALLLSPLARLWALSMRRCASHHPRLPAVLLAGALGGHNSDAMRRRAGMPWRNVKCPSQDDAFMERDAT